MGKLKTKKTLTRRIKITKTGKLLHKQTNRGHLKIKHDSSRKSRKAGSLSTSKGHIKLFKRLLGR